MALAKSLSISLFGLTGRLIEVEADISSNLPGFVLVGLPDASLQEASARVRAACVNTGLAWPNRKITVNLSPASVPKSGSGFDLAIAASILAANEVLPAEALLGTVLLGELTLDGAVRGIRGVLPSVQAAKKLGVTKFIVPAANLAEAELVDGVSIVGVSNLAEFASRFGVTAQLRIPTEPIETPTQAAAQTGSMDELDMLAVGRAARCGQNYACPAAAGHPAAARCANSHRIHRHQVAAWSHLRAESRCSVCGSASRGHRNGARWRRGNRAKAWANLAGSRWSAVS
jgi:magnesium chelatase family protein